MLVYGATCANSDRILFWLFLWLVIEAILAGVFGYMAEEKGHSFGRAACICFFLGLFGAVYVASLPDMTAREMARIVLKRENETKREFDYLKKEIAELTHQIDELKKKNEE